MTAKFKGGDLVTLVDGPEGPTNSAVRCYFVDHDGLPRRIDVPADLLVAYVVPDPPAVVAADPAVVAPNERSVSST